MNTVICTYRVKKGGEAAFEALLKQHWPTLNAQGLAGPAKPQHFKRHDDQGRPEYREIFDWKDADAPHKAHENAAVMAVWGPMGELVEERDGKPPMEFPHFAKFVV